MSVALTNYLVNRVHSSSPFVIKYIPYGGLSEVRHPDSQAPLSQSEMAVFLTLRCLICLGHALLESAGHREQVSAAQRRGGGGEEAGCCRDLGQAVWLNASSLLKSRTPRIYRRTWNIDG